MSFTKITEADTTNKGVVGLPDTPSLSTMEMQQKFDELATDVIIPKFNNLVDELDGVDIEKRIKSDDVTDIRLNLDNNIEVSTDGGRTYKQTASSGHIIMDGTGRSFPQRSRMQYSANVVVTDNPTDNTTFLQVPSGVKGDKGDSATIQVGNVSTSPTPFVTNVGSQYDAIFDFGIPQGKDGDSATIQVGTVTSGTSASVSNRGTSSAAIFDFVLPKGEKGDSGTSFQVLGTYPTFADLLAAHPVGNRGDAYAVGDATFNEIYNWNNDTATWDNLGGLKGVKGDDGLAATITIGSVTQGTAPFVENVGTAENAILNFTLEKGSQGDKGDAATIAVGSVTKGDNPSVINSGTTTNAVFDFVIPKGDKGDPGEPTIINGKQGESVVLYGYDMYLKNYAKASQYSEINDDDSIQSAIGKLEARNSGGSKIVVYTDDESIGNTFEVSNGVKTLTQIADSSMKMEFFVDDIGEWTITNVEAGNISTIKIEYFSAYSVTLGVGDVNIVITYSSEYIGSDFIITNNGVTKQKTATSDLSVSFVVADYGAWVITNTFDAKTKTINATEGGTYTADFSIAPTPAYDFQSWLDAAAITKSFDSLESVLEDQATIRELMTKHASVDYLVEWYENDPTLKATLLASNYALKWIGLRDYAYDKMPSEFITEWLASDKWEYALKDKVPTMTSDSAPYGTVIYSSQLSSSARYGYQAFDKNNSTMWSTEDYYKDNCYIGYKFTNPICVKKFSILKTNRPLRAPKNFKLQGSNDNTTWDDVSDVFVGVNTETTDIYITDNDNYYLYYRVYIETNFGDNADTELVELQFYGRSLSVSVPTMTSNTEPWGEAFGSSYYGGGYEYFRAFDGADDFFIPHPDETFNDFYLGYDFKNPTLVKAFSIQTKAPTMRYSVQGWNGSEWINIYESVENADTTLRTYEIDNTNLFIKYRIKITSASVSPVNVSVRTLQFYGLDYSEHEERHWIYDHGVEVEEVKTFNKVDKEDNQFIIDNNSTSTFATAYTESKDLTPYKRQRAKVGNVFTNGAMATSLSPTTATTPTYRVMVGSDLPNNAYEDLSNVNGSFNLMVYANGTSSTGKASITEWWLE